MSDLSVVAGFARSANVSYVHAVDGLAAAHACFHAGVLSGSYLDALIAVADASVHVELMTRDLVRAARASGASWSEIADCLGVTKQSAWGKYSGALD